jgi:DNA-binding NarL/FixJ family response regulator
MVKIGDAMSLKIILVESNDLMRSVLTQFVQEIDQCSIVAEAKSGIEALDAIRDIPADLVMLGLILPNFSGVEVLRRAKKFSAIKSLVVTILTDKDIIDQVLDAGADGIVQKDMGREILKKAILEVFEGKHPVYCNHVHSMV